MHSHALTMTRRLKERELLEFHEHEGIRADLPRRQAALAECVEDLHCMLRASGAAHWSSKWIPDTMMGSPSWAAHYAHYRV